MIAIPAFAPGCFGSALAFQESHPLCASCQFVTDCKPLHEVNLAHLKKECHIQDRRSFTMNSPSAGNPNPGARVLTKKVREYLDKIEKAGIRITEGLSQGVNPFDPKVMSFMHVAAHLLLRLKEPVQSRTLALAFTRRFNCGESTAEAYVRITTQILRHVGAVDVMDGGMILRRSKS